MKSGTTLKMGHVGSKTRSLGHILEKPCVRFKGHIFDSILIKILVRMFFLVKSRTNLKMDHVRSKKLCVRSRADIFSPTIMKLGQNVSLDKISDELKNGSYQVKNWVTRSSTRKNLLYALEATFSIRLL